MLGILRIEVKHVNHKSYVHQISECECNCVWLHQCGGCIVVD